MARYAQGFDTVVVDASLIISLERLKPTGVGTTCLRTLFAQLLIPEKAMSEVLRGQTTSLQEYCQKYHLQDFLHVASVQMNTNLLDIHRLYDNKKDHDYEGEAYAMSLAFAEGFCILLDDITGIQIAIKNGLKVYNIATAALRAYKHGCLAKEETETVILAGYSANMYSKTLYEQYLGRL